MRKIASFLKTSEEFMVHFEKHANFNSKSLKFIPIELYTKLDAKAKKR